MGYVNYKGIVLREVNTGEADKIITVLTAEEGKISIAAKDAQQQKFVSSGTRPCYVLVIICFLKARSSIICLAAKL